MVKMLTFEILSDDRLEIHGSLDGLKLLTKTIEKLILHTKDGSFDHEHLMSETWGGNELSSIQKNMDSELINHVKIYCWKNDNSQ